MRFSRGGGPLVVVGALFAVAGAAAGFLGLLGLAENDSDQTLFLIGAVLFLGIGIVLMFGRSVQVLDRRAGRIITSQGVLGLRRSRSRSLADFDRVGLEPCILQTEDSRDEVFHVELQGAAAPLLLFQTRHYLEARGRAEIVANYLGLALADSGAGPTVFRRAGTLDDDLRAQTSRSGEALSWPELPAGSSIAYHTEGDQAFIDLPGSRLGAAIAVAPVLGFAIVLDGVVITFLPLWVSSSARRWLSLGAIVISLGALALIAAFLLQVAAGRPPGERVTVSARALRIDRSRLWRTQSWVFPAETLEELMLTPGVSHPLAAALGLSGGLTVRTDSAALTFARTVSEPERAWLHGVIRFILSNVA